MTAAVLSAFLMALVLLPLRTSLRYGNPARLLVGLVVSQFSARARALRRAALSDARYLERLHAVARLVRSGDCLAGRRGRAAGRRSRAMPRGLR
ncbi:hypothetical protein O1L60_40755 [Streptomyces diastatochromogenes]|nr:hypothetical protein [Streptomyces diastatochromogenes]